jgi:hypothetical protein
VKRILATFGTALFALVLAITAAVPAHADGSVWINDPAGDQIAGSYWGAASQNARDAADVRGVNASSSGGLVTFTWHMASVLPTTNTSYSQSVFLRGTMSDKNLDFYVGLNGNQSWIYYDHVSPQCSGYISVSRDTVSKVINLQVPRWCLPNGYNLNNINGEAEVVRWSTGEVVAYDGYAGGTMPY